MTKDEALKMAIEALNDSCGLCGRNYEKEINACKEALANNEKDDLAFWEQLQSDVDQNGY
jgi:hypothetical protein